MSLKMILFESSGRVSYLHSIAGLAAALNAFVYRLLLRMDCVSSYNFLMFVFYSNLGLHSQCGQNDNHIRLTLRMV